MPKRDPSDIAEFELDSSRSAEEIRVQVRLLIRDWRFEGRVSNRRFLIRRVIGRGRMKFRGPWIEGRIEPQGEGTLIHLVVMIRDYRESVLLRLALTTYPVVIMIVTMVVGSRSPWPLLLVAVPLADVVLKSLDWKISPEEEVERIVPILSGMEDAARHPVPRLP